MQVILSICHCSLILTWKISHTSFQGIGNCISSHCNVHFRVQFNVYCEMRFVRCIPFSWLRRYVILRDCLSATLVVAKTSSGPHLGDFPFQGLALVLQKLGWDWDQTLDVCSKSVKDADVLTGRDCPGLGGIKSHLPESAYAAPQSKWATFCDTWSTPWGRSELWEDKNAKRSWCCDTEVGRGGFREPNRVASRTRPRYCAADEKKSTSGTY